MNAPIYLDIIPSTNTWIVSIVVVCYFCYRKCTSTGISPGFMFGKAIGASQTFASLAQCGIAKLFFRGVVPVYTCSCSWCKSMLLHNLNSTLWDQILSVFANLVGMKKKFMVRCMHFTHLQWYWAFFFSFFWTMMVHSCFLFHVFSTFFCLSLGLSLSLLIYRSSMFILQLPILC